MALQEKKKIQINVDKELAEQAERELRETTKRAPNINLNTPEKLEAWFKDETQDY
ncbi:hypothetical protein LOOC260_120160 [Paucilactobacillus hokkaidonensis JCM 18461]|uniref:Uncharacterized protein n=2 Tax=Paucilactobacillus hokkaidonensis TaxID=1193095 RepID=A0A0A1GW88_9LACO|nr:hypothetical protein [Paucilactobacillus hokkaidonensis]KRO11114.1 hypothetical protein IV59_GL000866 [Paucilactobacillus hokkaidonensis]BAP86522.1 hypothetical protein LOOC260_120160 [Paucilactobacillus hokkaidonensis JCM 18461]